MKINGWQRIGIIASVVWSLGAYSYTYHAKMTGEYETAGLAMAGCLDYRWDYITQRNVLLNYNECKKQHDISIVAERSVVQMDAALVALVPVPLGWVFGYLVLFLLHWVRRGFM